MNPADLIADRDLRNHGMVMLAKGIRMALLGDVDTALKQCGHSGTDRESFRQGWIEGRFALYSELHDNLRDSL